MKKQIVININQELVPSDKETESAFRKIATELLSAEYDVSFEDIGTTYSWKDLSGEIDADEGFFIQGALERAWNEANF